MYIVTGCAGFIASRVTEMLLDQGHPVLGIDNLNDAYDPRLKHWRLRRLQAHIGFTFIEHDVADPSAAGRIAVAVRRSGQKPVAVLNLAARAGVQPSVENPHVYIETNVTGTLNMMELCRRLDVSKFVMASSSSVYGDSAEGPAAEDSATDRPLSPYAASKKAAEVLAHSYHHLHGLDVSALRYFTVYGPAGRPDMSVLRFIRWIATGHPLKLYGDGSQERDFTYVDDIARGTIAALRPVGCEAFNLGSDRPFTISALISMIEDAVGREAVIDRRPAHPADVKATWADITKARNVLGWSPQTPLESGLRRTVAWYMENRELADSLLLEAAPLAESQRSAA